MELLVVIAIAGVLGALISGAVACARAEANATTCVSNLRQWAAAMQLYVNDNQGYLPRRGQGMQPVFEINRPQDWFNALPPYLGLPTIEQGPVPKPGDKSVFVCPSATMGLAGQYFLSYGMNMYLSRWDQPTTTVFVLNPTKVIMLPNSGTIAFMADSPGGYASTVPSSLQYSVEARHNGYANVSFLDGHVQAFAGNYLGCGTHEIEQPDVHWKTEVPGDTWTVP